MPQLESAMWTAIAGTAVAPGLRVVNDTDGDLKLAGATDREFGVAEGRANADQDAIAVRLRNAEGTVRMVASAAITQYAQVYGAASGKISSTANGNPIGVALTAATADGDAVEVLRVDSASGDFVGGAARTWTAKTANYTVLAAESGQGFTTVGAGAAVTFALPAATVGLRYRFRVGAAQELRIDPNGSEVIALPSTGVAGATGKYLTADADGETVDIECTKTGTWSVFGFTGTWTAEP